MCTHAYTHTRTHTLVWTPAQTCARARTHTHHALGHDFKMCSLLQFMVRTSRVTWEVTGSGWECVPQVLAVPALTASAEGTGDIVWLLNKGGLSPRAGQPLSAREMGQRETPAPNRKEEDGSGVWGALGGCSELHMCRRPSLPDSERRQHVLMGHLSVTIRGAEHCLVSCELSSFPPLILCWSPNSQDLGM